MKRKALLKKEDRLSLEKRYLLWLYKTTKDELDKIERKFTQLDIDRDLQKAMEKGGPAVKAFVDEWKVYVYEKETATQKIAFGADGSYDAKYLFLRVKLDAVEAVTARRFGKKTLSRFKKLYEDACAKRILEESSSGQR